MASRPPAGNNKPRSAPSLIRLGTKARERIDAGILIKRLQSFAIADPDNPRPGDVRMTRTQAFIALALLRKVLPDLASVELSGNPDRPLQVQVIRFSDPEPLVIDAVAGDAVGGKRSSLDANSSGAPMRNGLLEQLEPELADER